MMTMVAVAAMVATADNWSFTYQAELKDATGKQALTGPQSVELRLWSQATGGTASELLWGKVYNVYLDANGLFNLEVSDDAGSNLSTSPTPSAKRTLSDVFTGQDAGKVYIGLTVVTTPASSEIVPRQRVFATPFAGTANAARSLTGATVPVQGIIKFAEGGTISSSGVALSGNGSAISASKVTVSEIDATGGTLTTKNIEFSGTLTKDTEEVLPVPIGGIILWNKSNPPEGGSWSKNKSAHWAICNGENDTPNLCGRFVVGVGDGGTGTNYSLGQKDGGSEAVTLGPDHIPSHSHMYYGDDELSTIDTVGGSVGVGGYDADSKKSGNSRRYNTDSVGKGQAHENRPPFYALYYIMRIR